MIELIMKGYNWLARWALPFWRRNWSYLQTYLSYWKGILPSNIAIWNDMLTFASPRGIRILGIPWSQTYRLSSMFQIHPQSIWSSSSRTWSLDCQSLGMVHHSSSIQSILGGVVTVSCITKSGCIFWLLFVDWDGRWVRVWWILHIRS